MRGSNREREDVPGNSVREMGERMKGGAVRDERSPEKAAMLGTQSQSAQGTQLLLRRQRENGHHCRRHQANLALALALGVARGGWVVERGEGEGTHALRKEAQLLFWAAGTACETKRTRKRRRRRKGGERASDAGAGDTYICGYVPRPLARSAACPSMPCFDGGVLAGLCDCWC